jgi:hypothetical protein
VQASIPPPCGSVQHIYQKPDQKDRKKLHTAGIVKRSPVRGLSDLPHRQLLMSANLTKCALGGSYQGMVTRDRPPKRKQ